MKPLLRLPLIVSGLLSLLLVGLAVAGSTSQAQAPIIWSTPEIISQADRFNWFADAAVDIYGTLHVVWDGGPSISERESHPDDEISLLMHSQLVGDTWTEPLDINAKINVEGHIYRAALTADRSGNLLALYEGDLIKAPAQTANESAANWVEASAVSNGAVYMGAILADDNGVLHALYDELTLLEEPVRGVFGQVTLTHLSDIIYRRSLDGGRTWSDSINFSRTDVGEHREKLEIDPSGGIYATWDEGWDRLTELGKPEEGVLVISRDSGQTWSSKITFAAPERTNAQFVAIGDGRDGVMGVWRTTSRDEIFYSWSTDGGDTWSVPQPIPGIYARPWQETRFDSYDLATDSAGTIHLALVGRRTLEKKDTQVYHLSWNGRNWSEPHLIFGGEGWPEYPRIITGQGNRLHLVWFLRERLETPGSFYQIWYSGATTTAPPLPLPPTPTSTPTSTPTPTPIIIPTKTPPPVTITPNEIKAVTELSTILYSENDDLILMLKSLAPVLVVIVGFILGRRFFGRG